MEHSKNYFKFRQYYLDGLWSKEKLHNTVGTKNGIYDWEYVEIVGEDNE